MYFQCPVCLSDGYNLHMVVLLQLRPHPAKMIFKSEVYSFLVLYNDVVVSLVPFLSV
jgi:hypothetical protein